MQERCRRWAKYNKKKKGREKFRFYSGQGDALKFIVVCTLFLVMLIKDFDSWNVLKQAIDASVPSTKIREGEIRWCKFGVNVGYEALGKGKNFQRPVLILKKFSTDIFLALPLTTKVKVGSWFYPLNDGQRCVLLSQSKVLDRRRLEEKMFELTALDLQKIKQAYCALILS